MSPGNLKIVAKCGVTPVSGSLFRAGRLLEDKKDHQCTSGQIFPQPEHCAYLANTGSAPGRDGGREWIFIEHLLCPINGNNLVRQMLALHSLMRTLSSETSGYLPEGHTVGQQQFPSDMNLWLPPSLALCTTSFGILQSEKLGKVFAIAIIPRSSFIHSFTHQILSQHFLSCGKRRDLLPQVTYKPGTDFYKTIYVGTFL